MTDLQRKSGSSARDRRDSEHANRSAWSPELDFGRGALLPRAEDPAPGIAYSDLPRRSIAFFIDLILIQTTATMVLQVTWFLVGETLLGGTGVTDTALSAWLGFALPASIVAVVQAVVIVFFLRAYRSTPGQLMLGIRTVRAGDGARLGRARATLRWLVTLMPAWAIAASSNVGVWWAAAIMRSPSASISQNAVYPSGLTITLSVVWFMVLFVSMLIDRRGRGIQDRLASSVVVQAD